MNWQPWAPGLASWPCPVLQTTGCVCVCVCVRACVRVSRSVVSDSLRPRGREPARLLCPWDSPGRNTGLGCHALLLHRAAREALVEKSHADETHRTRLRTDLHSA